MNLKNLPPMGQLGAALAVGVGLIFLQFKMAPADLSAKQSKVAALADQLEKKEAEIRKGKQAYAKLEELQRDIAGLERKLTDLRQILPTQPEMGDLLKWIKSLADQTNLDLRVFNPQSLAEQEFLREQPIKMEVIGNYHQLGLFFDRVSKYARIINVEDVKMQPNSDKTVRATIKATFTAKTYIYREEADQQAAAQPGGDT
ncbi:MAG: type 4a pilus biogenesis protein PilO [Acidobacteriota bacterium]